MLGMMMIAGRGGIAQAEAEGPVPATVIILDVVGGTGEADIEWQEPSTKYDGTALSAADISHYIVRRYNTSGVQQGSDINVGNVLTYNHTGLSAGDWEWTVACVSDYGEGEESSRWPATVS